MISEDDFVYLPEKRAYGWDFAPPPNQFFVPGRVFSLVARLDERRWQFEPIEGGPVRTQLSLFFVPLARFPASTISSSVVELADIEDLTLGGREYYLGLRRKDWRDSSPAYQFPQIALSSVGLTAGQRYKIERWVVPGYALRLAGVEGVHCSQFFVACD